MVAIRDERPTDAEAIAALTGEAFAGAPHASGTEAQIVDELRRAGALSLSLAAEDREIVGQIVGQIVGHVAFSPVLIDGVACGWFGLGPVSVKPAMQGRGIGGQLVREGLERLARSGAQGCVVLGDPDYYRRFGFESDPGLTYGDVDQRYFQRLVFCGQLPRGEVAFHVAFGA